MKKKQHFVNVDIYYVSVLQQIISKNQSKFKHDSAYHINMYIFDKAFPLFDCAITKVFSMFSFFVTSYVISYIQDIILKMSFTDLQGNR